MFKYIFILLSFAALAQFESSEKLSVGSPPAVSADAVLQLNSTAKGAIFAPKMTTAQRLAIPAPVTVGLTVYDTTLLKYFTHDGNDWKGLGSGLVNWAASTVYRVGDAILVNSDIWQATVDHLSGSDFFTDFSLGRWRTISSPSLSSSSISGGRLTKNPGNKKSINVSAGGGAIVDSFSEYPLRKNKRVGWTDTTLDVSTFGIGADSKFYVYVDTNSNFQMVDTLPGITFLQQQVVVGQGVTDNNGDVLFVADRAWLTSNTDAYLASFMLDVGLISKGFAYSGNADLTLKREAGRLVAVGANPSDVRDPNSFSCAQTTPMPMYLALSDKIESTPVTNMDVGFYQPNGIGPKIAVPVGKWTIHRFYQSVKCSTFSQYGQKIYDTQADAIVGYPIDPHIKNTLFSDDAFLHDGYAIVSAATNNLSDSAQAKVITCGQWGCGSSGNASVGLPGDVVGPAVSVDNTIAIFDGLTGKKIKQGTSFRIGQTPNLLGSYIYNNKIAMGENETYPNAGCIANTSFADSPLNYAFCQGDLGSTIVNSAQGQRIGFGIGGTAMMAVQYEGVGIGTGTNLVEAKAALELRTTTKGFLPPRVTSVQRDKISGSGVASPAIAEISSLVVAAKPANLNYFVLYDSPTATVCVYGWRTNQTDVPPTACTRNIRFNFSPSDNEATVASIINAAVNPDAAFNSTVAGTTVTITHAAAGDIPDVVSAASAFTLSVTTQGENASAGGAGSAPEGLAIYNLTTKQDETWNGTKWVGGAAFETLEAVRERTLATEYTRIGCAGVANGTLSITAPLNAAWPAGNIAAIQIDVMHSGNDRGKLVIVGVDQSGTCNPINAVRVVTTAGNMCLGVRYAACSQGWGGNETVYTYTPNSKLDNFVMALGPEQNDNWSAVNQNARMTICTNSTCNDY